MMCKNIKNMAIKQIYLAYQVGWTTLVLKWEDDEKHGIEPNLTLKKQ